MAGGEGLQANQAGGDRSKVGGEWEWERRKWVGGWVIVLCEMGLGFFIFIFIFIIF